MLSSRSESLTNDPNMNEDGDSVCSSGSGRNANRRKHRVTITTPLDNDTTPATTTTQPTYPTDARERQKQAEQVEKEQNGCDFNFFLRNHIKKVYGYCKMSTSQTSSCSTLFSQ